MEGSNEDGAGGGLPAVLGKAASAVPEPWRQKAALAIFKLIAGSAGPKIAQARDNWALMDARERVTGALADEVAKRAIADPEIVGRAMERMLADEFRAQSNREAVAAMALEDLSRIDDADPNEDGHRAFAGEDPDEDWMRKFGNYAEDISDVDMQRLWGRVLAGEIRRKGTFSLRTLRYLSDLDQHSAKLFERYAAHNIGGNALFLIPQDYQRGKGHREISDLIDAGLIIERTGRSNRPLSNSQTGEAIMVYGTKFGLIFRPIGMAVSIPIVQLSRVGMELISLIENIDEKECLLKVAEYIRKNNPKLTYGALCRQEEVSEVVRMVPIKVLWGAG